MTKRTPKFWEAKKQMGELEGQFSMFVDDYTDISKSLLPSGRPRVHYAIAQEMVRQGWHKPEPRALDIDPETL